MANYTGAMRTNYFRVTNEDELVQLIDECHTDDPKGVELWTCEDEDGTKRYAFACEGDLLGLACDEEPEDYDYDDFIAELQKLLPEGEAVVITSIGKQKLCYLHGDVHVVTKDKTIIKSLRSIGIDLARELLGDSKWDTKNEY